MRLLLAKGDTASAGSGGSYGLQVFAGIDRPRQDKDRPAHHGWSGWITTRTRRQDRTRNSAHAKSGCACG